MERHLNSKPIVNLFSVVLGGAAVILALAKVPTERIMPRPGLEYHSVTVNVQETPGPRNPAVGSYSDAVKRAAPSVVNIYSSRTFADSCGDSLLTDPLLRHFFGDHIFGAPETHIRPHRSQSLGSGVICTADGFILTNFHVVDDADEIRVTLADGRTEYTAKIIGADSQTDVAVIKIDAKNLPVATLGNSDQLQVGDVVLALGNPFGVGQTVTMGIASAVGRGGFGVEDIEDFIQTDASINPGNSGGALIDSQGRLVGLNAAILTRSGGNQGIGFAVPINLAREVMTQILKSGRVARGFLGVTTQALTPDLARAFNLPEKQAGALIGEVLPNTPASAAGLQEGDVIVSLNGKPINDSRGLRLIISQTAPNASANLQILHAGKVETRRTILSEKPEATGSPEMLNARTTEAKNGGYKESSFDAVEVAELTSEVRQMLEIPSAIKGAVVAKVEPGSDSYEAGLRVGDVITDVNGQPVKNADAAMELCHHNKTALLRVWSKNGKHYVAVNNEMASK